MTFEEILAAVQLFNQTAPLAVSLALSVIDHNTDTSVVVEKLDIDKTLAEANIAQAQAFLDAHSEADNS